MAYHPSLGRFVQRDPKEYFDGPNLYEVEKGDPVDALDPMGLWKIKRLRQETATAVAEGDGDTVEKLAEKAQLDPAEARKWMQPYKDSKDVKNCDEVEVPNTVYVTKGDVTTPFRFIFVGYPWLREGVEQSAARISTRFVEDKRAEGYDVVDLGSYSATAMKVMLANENTVGWFHVGHGTEGVLELADGTMVAPGQFKGADQNHKWTFVYLFACQAAQGAKHGIGMGWYDLVRQPYGHLYASNEELIGVGKEYTDLPEYKEGATGEKPPAPRWKIGRGIESGYGGIWQIP